MKKKLFIFYINLMLLFFFANFHDFKDFFLNKQELIEEKDELMTKFKFI